MSSRFGGFEFGIHNNASVNVPMLSQLNHLSKKHKNAFITDGNYDSNIKVSFPFILFVVLSFYLKNIAYANKNT